MKITDKERKTKNEELGTKIGLSAIVKKAQQKREETQIVPSGKNKKYYPMPIKVSKELWEHFRNLYYTLVKELGEEYIVLTRSDVFIALIDYMDKNIDTDISKYQDLYDRFVAVGGKRSRNERSHAENDELINCTWANFSFEQLQQFKRVITKLAVQVGIEKRADFSKQYFISDIISFFEENLSEIVNHIKGKRNS